MESKKIYAVTGGIGSGKSEVLRILSSLGYPTLSCDEIYKNLLNESKTIEKLSVAFPSCVSGGKLDKQKLSSIVFADNEKLSLLNSLTHPLILERLFALANEESSKLVFAEIPLYFESKLEKYFSGAVVVTRNLGDRISSVITRSGLTESQVKERISRQTDYDNLDLSNYIVIKNNGDIHSLTNAVKTALSTIIE